MELQTETKRTKEDVRVWIKRMSGIIPNTGDSVEEVREIRRKLSKEPFNIDEINALGKR